MGQYYVIANLDRRTGYTPRALGDGVKLHEFGYGGATMESLVHLLAGPWSSDRIALIGDYTEPGELPDAATNAAGMDSHLIYPCITGEAATWVDASPEAREHLAGLLTHSEYKRVDLDGTETTVQYSEYLPPVTVPEHGPAQVIVNLDKNEQITPAGFGDPAHREGFAVHGGGGGILTALTVLLATGVGKGNAMLGSWTGDRIAVVDADSSAAVGSQAINRDVRELLADDEWATYTVNGGAVTRQCVGFDEGAGIE